MTADDVCIRAHDAMALLGPLSEIVAQASRAILNIDRDALDVSGKSDGSPVTQADLASDRIIAEGLARLLPGVPVLSEERTQEARAPFSGSFLIVDPLDGTKEYIAGRNEFTVNVALVTEATPVLGIVAAPALGLLWRGVVGHGAERFGLAHFGHGFAATIPPAKIRTRPIPRDGHWVATVSRSHSDALSESFISARPGAMRLPAGSAVKFCHVAEGRADIYPRLAPTGEWDVAAGHALVTAAGGKVTDGDGNALRFGQNRNSFLVPQFVAYGDPAAG